MAARELSSEGHEVLVLEAGRPFQAFTRRIGWTSKLREVGLLGGEKTIDVVFPHISTLRSSADLVLVRGVTTGGSTVISCGNAVRADDGLKEIGLDLSKEYREVEELLKPAAIPWSRWRPVTQRMFESAESLGLSPAPTPKMVDVSKCVSCGLCELGCKAGARWSSVSLFPDIEACGGRILAGSPVRRVIVEGGRAKGVEVGNGGSIRRYEADAVVLAAGGVGTAQILEASGVPTADRLWVDVVLTLGGVLKDAHQFRETPMAWYVKRPGFIISPYPDILSHLFHKPWRGVSEGDRVGVMVKLADEQNGSVDPSGAVRKELTGEDRARLAEGVGLAESIMRSAGVSGPYVEGLLNGGHLGGTVPLSRGDIHSMRPGWLPEGLWVADLSLVPKSQGLPTIMTAMALALKVSRKVE
jgi:choline dehydrogenase-like flavoprotein